MGRISWPTEGSLFQPADIRVIFDTSLDDLRPGTYILYQDGDKGGVGYSSIDGTLRGSFFTFEYPFAITINTNSGVTPRLVGQSERGTTYYVIDLRGQEVQKLTPLCTKHLPYLSPSGASLAQICTPESRQLEGSLELEVTSLDHGTTVHLVIEPRSGRRFSGGKITWLDDNHFIAEIGPDEEPCLVSLANQAMRCAPLIRNELVDVSPRGTWLRTGVSPQNTAMQEIYLLECFDNSARCYPVVTGLGDFDFPEEMYWSPDESKLAVLTMRDGLLEDPTEVGYYYTQTWTYHRIAVLPPEYGLLDWCPDSSCMVVARGLEISVLYLDGRMEPVPFPGGDTPGLIAVIAVPWR